MPEFLLYYQKGDREGENSNMVTRIEFLILQIY